MSKILILDDDETRLDQFRKYLIGHEVTTVTTAREAIEALDRNCWSCVFLDHDLGGSVLVASGPGTGYEVAKWLAEHPGKQPPRIITHSFNEPGRRNIIGVLPQTLSRPGIWTMYDLLIETVLEER